MADAVTAGGDKDGVNANVAIAERPSSAGTVRMPALPDPGSNTGPRSHRYLPEVLADAGPLMEIGTALELSVVGRIAVRNGAIADLAVSGDGTRLVATNFGDDSVSVIDTNRRAVAMTVTGVAEPYAIATGGHVRAYLSTATNSSDGIAAFDLNTDDVVATYPVDHSVRDVAVSPDGRFVYASRVRADGADLAILTPAAARLEVIDLTMRPGTLADRLVLSADGRRLYIATQHPAGSALVVVDTVARRIVDTLEIGSRIRDIALSRDGGIAYVASCGSQCGGVIDLVDTQAGVIAGGLEIGGFGEINQLRLSNDGNRAYLVSGDGVIIMSTLTHDVIETVALKTQPSCVAESTDGRQLYIADCAGMITVMSIAWTTASLIGEVADRPELLESEPALA